MSVRTTADEHVSEAIKHVFKAREEIGKVLLDRNMWGRDEFKRGYIKNLFDRLDCLANFLEGED